MWEVDGKDFEIIENLNLKEDPFRAVKEYSPLISEMRWELPEQKELYDSYTKKRKLIEVKMLIIIIKKNIK